MSKSMKQLSLCDMCDQLKLKFKELVNESFEKNNINYEYKDNLIDMMETSIFGLDSKDVKKVDDNKNRNLIKQILLNFPDLYNTTGVLADIYKYFSDFVSYVSEEFSTKSQYKNKLTDTEFEKLDGILSAYSWELGHLRIEVTDLRSLIKKSGFMSDRFYEYILAKQNRDQSIDSGIENLKKDSLKKYYFNDVYILKTGVKYFDKDYMIFGETNTIMRLFNKFTDFLLRDFKFMYIVIKTHMNTVIR